MDSANEWVHCNQCYFQPQSGQCGRTFLLTSCGHLLCTNCTGSTDVSNCIMCKTSCSSVRLTKQLPSEVAVYFTSPNALIDKFVAQFVRVVKFQRGQSDRLMQHKIAMIQKKIQQTQAATDKFTRENNLMKAQLAQHSPSPNVFVNHSYGPPTHTPQSLPSGGWVTPTCTPRSASSCSHTPKPPSGGRVKPPTPSSGVGMRSLTPDVIRKGGYVSRQSRMCVRTPPINGRMGIIPSPIDQSLVKGASSRVVSSRHVQSSPQHTPLTSPSLATPGMVTPRHHVARQMQAGSDPQRMHTGGWLPAPSQRILPRMVSPRITSPHTLPYRTSPYIH